MMPSAPAATAARAMGATLSRIPVAWLGSTIIGRWESSLITGTQERSSVLRVDGIDILVVSEAVQMYDQQQFRNFGIDPTSKTVVALKSMQHFRAAFEPIAEKVIVCDSGALCTTDVTKLPYQNVPRPMYPLDPDMTR